jgi:hypothetical protein
MCSALLRRQQDGYTLLHHAVATNSVAVARLLVKNGASVVIKTFRVRAAAARPRARMTPALCPRHLAPSLRKSIPT